MTIINPNSISGITSFTAEADVMNFYRSNGTLGSLQLNGCNFHTPTGISTFNNLNVGGTLTYEDVKNVDSVGIISARTAIHVGAGISAVGIITGTSFRGDGSQLTGITIPGGNTGLDFNDNVKARFGTGNDLEIYFQGADSYFRNDNGGNIVIVNSTTGTIELDPGGGKVQIKNDLEIADSIIHTGDTNTKIRFPSADTITAETGGTERLRIDSSGRLLVNQSSNYTVYADSKLQISATDSTAAFSVTRWSNNGSSPYINLGKSRGGIGNYTAVQSGDRLGQINFVGADGTDLASHAASIAAYVDGTPGSNDMPGRLVFATASDGGAAETERLRITSDGNIRQAWSDGKFMGQYYDSTYYMGFTYGATARTLYIDNRSNDTRADIVFRTKEGGAPEERLRITSDGKLGIGENSPSTAMHLKASDAYFTMQASSSSGNAGILFKDSGGTQNSVILYDFDDDYLKITTNNDTERLRIDSSGRTLIGHNANLSEGCLLQVARANDNTVELFGYSANANGARVNFTKSRNGTIGTNTIVQDGDTIGELHFRAANGSGYYRVAEIAAEMDGTPSTSSLPGRLIFATTPSGATTQTERLRIDSSGNLGIARTNPSYRLHIHTASTNSTQVTGLCIANDASSSGVGAKINLGAGNGFDSTSAGISGWYDGTGTSLSLFTTASYASTGHVERLRIDSSGRVLIERTGNDFGLNSNDAAMHINTPTNGGQGGLFIRCRGQSAGTASPHYGIKIDALGCANNANLQSGILIDLNQQYTQSGTGIQSDVYGSYNTTKCFDGILRKQVGAYTNGYTFHSNIIQTSSGGSSFHFRGQNDGSDRIRIELGGNVKNTNNSYGSLSDIKLKQNIVDANSQWDDIKAVKVRNFEFKHDPGVKLLGVVAQEIETVSAGLVDTDNDITMDEETGEGTVTGTTKSVKYSVLYMKAIKALQEAMARIETLEAEVAALKSA